MRNTLPNSEAPITWPSLNETTPKVALMSVATAALITSARTSLTRSRPVLRPARQQEEHGPDDDLERVPDRLAENRPPRRRKVRDEQVADHDPGPEAEPPDHERGDPDADRRPQRRDASVKVGETKTGARGSVVKPGYDGDPDHIPGEAPGVRLPPGPDTPGQRPAFL